MIIGGKSIEFISEVKTTSPFDGSTGNKTWEELFDIANSVGDILSIHTSERWGGEMQNISKAVKRTKKPILAKGIHETDKQVREAIERGADYVLVVGRIPQIHQDKILYEVESLRQLKEFKNRLPDTAKIVWNSRSLKDGSLKTETFKQAREIWGGWLCQASNISNISDIERGADAILVGTQLESFITSYNI